MRSLRPIQRRLEQLKTLVAPAKRDPNSMSDAEIEIELTQGLECTFGRPLTSFDSFEEVETAYRSAGGRETGPLRGLWERARWFEDHAAHGPYRLAPGFAYRPLLSCSCGSHITVYRAVVPPDWWPRITEDDERRD